MSFDPALPRPYKEEWREAYRYDSDDTPRLSTYQAPGGSPIPFVMDNVRLSAGQSVDTAEYAFHGLWSNTPLNEKPHAITVNGFVRGETYIKNRNALVEALRITTDDADTGFIDLPLWGRFPVVVVSYDVEERGKENGQCSISLTFTRAGITVEERWVFDGGGFDVYGITAATAELLREAAIQSLEQSLAENIDNNAIAQGFAKIKDTLIAAIGRVQGAVSALDKMTNEAAGITNFLAQGIRAPRELAEALFGAAASIIAGAMEIKNTWDDTVSYFRISGNHKKLLLQFLSADTFRADIEAVTVKQHITKDSIENLYRAAALSAAGQILVQSEMTYQEAKGYWALYEKLEASVDQNNPDVYRAVRDMRLATARELSARKLDTELLKTFSHPLPLLYLSQILGCGDEKIRQLNTISDSFVIRGDVVYV